MDRLIGTLARWTALALIPLVTMTPPLPGAARGDRPSVSIDGGTFGWPVALPVVLTDFDPPVTPYGSGHRGIDLAAAVGTVVTAAGAGRVVYAGPLAGRGVVSIEHRSGLRTTYEPVLPRVAVGSLVTAGQPIGTVTAGHRPCAPATCLHWGARCGAVYLDPRSLLPGRWRVRLLPWEG